MSYVQIYKWEKKVKEIHSCREKKKNISLKYNEIFFIYDLLFYIINGGFILNNRSSLHKYKVTDLGSLH